MEPSKSQRREGNGAKRDEKGGVCQFFHKCLGKITKTKM